MKPQPINAIQMCKYPNKLLQKCHVPVVQRNRLITPNFIALILKLIEPISAMHPQIMNIKSSDKPKFSYDINNNLIEVPEASMMRIIEYARILENVGTSDFLKNIELNDSLSSHFLNDISSFLHECRHAEDYQSDSLKEKKDICSMPNFNNTTIKTGREMPAIYTEVATGHNIELKFGKNSLLFEKKSDRIRLLESGLLNFEKGSLLSKNKYQSQLVTVVKRYAVEYGKFHSNDELNKYLEGSASLFEQYIITESEKYKNNINRGILISPSPFIIPEYDEIRKKTF